jgi:hypothetical protein
MNTVVAELFEGVDDLIRRVADTENPEIRRVRARVHAALEAARSVCNPPVARAAPYYPPAYTESAAAASAEDPSTSDDKLPATGLGLIFLLGLGFCLVATSRS